VKKSVFVLVSSALLLTALAGCGSNTTETVKPDNAATAEKTEPMVLRWNVSGGEPPTADPGLATDNVSFDIVLANYEGLSRYGPDGKVTNAVAESYEASPDFTKFTFKMKKDLKWSNGDPLTAHDFEFAWKRNLDPKTASEYAYQLYYLKGGEEYNTGKGKAEDVGVKALDDLTLEVTLKSPTPFFYELTAFPTLFPLHRKTVEGNPNWANEAKTYIGNGPFKMETWVHKDKMVLVKNENYWDKENVKLDRIDLAMIEDDNTAFALFESGELDWGGFPAFGMPVDLVSKVKADGKLAVADEPRTDGVVFYTQKPPFNNKKIRQAFAYAISRQPIIDNILQTNAPAAFSWLPPSMKVKEDGYFKEDVNKAKQLLAEGMKELGLDKFPTVTYTYNTADRNKKVAEALQDQWKKTLGVDVKLQNSEWKVFLKDRNTGNFQLARYSWGADFNDPINFLELFKDKNGGNNDADYDNKQFRDLLNKSYTETDPEKRKQLFLEAETIMMEDMPVAPLFHSAQPYVKNEKVKGFLINPIGGNDFKYVTVEK